MRKVVLAMILLLLVVPKVNLTVVMDLVSLAHGHVMEWMTVLMAQMKPTAVAMAAPMVNLTVAMDLVSLAHGHVMAGMTVPMAQMKLTVVVECQMDGHVPRASTLMHGVTVDVVNMIQYVMILQHLNGITVTMDV